MLQIRSFTHISVTFFPVSLPPLLCKSCAAAWRAIGIKKAWSTKKRNFGSFFLVKQFFVCQVQYFMLSKETDIVCYTLTQKPLQLSLKPVTKFHLLSVAICKQHVMQFLSEQEKAESPQYHADVKWKNLVPYHLHISRETVLVLEEESHKLVTQSLASHPEKESRERSVQLHSSLVLLCLSVYQSMGKEWPPSCPGCSLQSGRWNVSCCLNV